MVGKTVLIIKEQKEPMLSKQRKCPWDGVLSHFFSISWPHSSVARKETHIEPLPGLTDSRQGQGWA